MTSSIASPRRLALALAAITTTAFVASCTETESQVVLEARLSGSLVISQVYGGGGNSGATYRNDFVELFNRGTTSVSLAGLSVQYASAGGAFQASGVVSLPSVMLAPGQYFLLSLAGGATGAVLPAADATNTSVNMSGTAGKVALVDGTTAIPCSGTASVCTLTDVIDYVGYGTTASQYEGTAAATAPSGNTGSVQRRLAGCMETDDNRADFESPASMVAPRNTMSTLNACAVVTDSGTDAFVDDTVDAGMDAMVIADAASDSPVDAAPDTFDVVDDATAFDAGTTDVFDGGGTSSSGLVISQVFGAGGNSGAAYTNDFIELFNRGSAPASLNGLSVQYASAAGTFGSTGVVALPNVIVPPGHYFLISLAGGTTGATLPSADHTGSVNMSGTAGRVALVNGTTAIPCASGVCIGANVLDYVGYGSTASEFEGSGPATVGTNAHAPQRRVAGCVDTNDNRADFENPALPANARNSSSPANDCTGSTTDAGVDVATDVIDVDSGTGVDASTDSGTGLDATVDVPATDASSGMDAIVPGSIPIVISQVYGAGGNSGATYTHDFVELFNRGTMAVSLNGLSLQYASSTGNFAAGGVTVLPDISVPAGAYFLVQMASGGTAGSALPGVDHANTAVNLSGSAGKVALVAGTTALGCGAGCSRASIVDLVGYGSAANFYEGSGPASAPTGNTNSAQRLRAGCVDTDDNAGDFESPVLSVRPRNSGSPLNDCSITTIDAGVVDSGRDVTVTDTGVDVRTDVGVDAPVTDAPRDVAADATRDAIDDVATADVAVDAGVDSGSLTDARTDAPRDANRDATGDATSDAGGWSRPGGCACSTPGGNGTAPAPRTAIWALAAIAAVITRRTSRRPV